MKDSKVEKLNAAIQARVDVASNHIRQLQAAKESQGKAIDDGYQLDGGVPIGVTLIKYEFLEWYEGFHTAVHALQDGHDQFKFEHKPSDWMNLMLAAAGLPAHDEAQWVPIAKAVQNYKRVG